MIEIIADVPYVVVLNLQVIGRLIALLLLLLLNIFNSQSENFDING